VGQGTIKSIQEFAARCRSPRQFKRLLEDLRSLLPYRGLVSISCNPTTHRIAQMVDVDYPRHYLGWYLATGMCRKDPAFQECLRTQQPQLRSEIMRRLPGRHNPEHEKKIKQFHLQYELLGAAANPDREGIFFVILDSEQEARRCLPIFGELLPALFQALSTSYRYPVLTDRKKTILLWRAQGKRPNMIASELGISQRTVKMHSEEIVRKLYAVDLVHAVWIAGQIGIIG
jgi:DNA-binding CsgD family transcriptional regulator